MLLHFYFKNDQVPIYKKKTAYYGIEKRVCIKFGKIYYVGFIDINV